jgi:hypothetical protein
MGVLGDEELSCGRGPVLTQQSKSEMVFRETQVTRQSGLAFHV